MNFQTLKWMIESLVKSYKCPMCMSEVDESDVSIIWAAWNTVNIDVTCGSCSKHSMVKIEVMWIDLTKHDAPADMLKELKSRFKNMQPNAEIMSGEMSLENPIKDENIVDLNKNLKSENLSVEDLFGDNNK